MEPNHTNPKPESRTHWILRLLGVSLVGVLLAASSAAAQVPAMPTSVTGAIDVAHIPATVGAGAGLPALPIPAIDESVATPIGYADIYAAAYQARVCHAIHAALPVATLAQAFAASAGCLELDAAGMTYSLAPNVAGSELSFAGSAELPDVEQGKAGLWAEVKGFVEGGFEATLDLF